MKPQNILSANLKQIVDYARLAPSVHNTQPWRITGLDAHSVEVSIDDTHTLKEGDPTGRQTVISLGIFCEAFIVAAQQFGLVCRHTAYDPGLRTARLRFVPLKPKLDTSLLRLLQSRTTDRSIFKPVELSQVAIAKIEAAGKSIGIETVVSTDPQVISATATLTSKGIGLALNSPGFRSELSRYLVEPWGHKRRGIAVRSLSLPILLELVQPWFVRLGSGSQAEANTELKRWRSASGDVIILGEGDMPFYWFEAGRAYLRVSLAIEGLGLSQATSAAIVEASDYHEDIENLLGTSKRILALMRIGRGSTRRHGSPRVSTNELITLH